MLRIDGKHTFYRIQHLGSNGCWLFSSFDHFGTPNTGHESDKFDASGDCWQQVGEHGVFDIENARKGFSDIQCRHPQQAFRIVRCVVDQSVAEVKSAEQLNKEAEEAKKREEESGIHWLGDGLYTRKGMIGIGYDPLRDPNARFPYGF